MKYVVCGQDATAQSPIGGKARALVDLARAGFPIPTFFSVKADAFAASRPQLDAHFVHERSNNNGSACVTRDYVHPSPEVETEIQAALADLCPDGELLAVRSSSEDEDGTRTSFAGQFESFLCVPPAEVMSRVADVWRSAFADRVLAYRNAHGLLLPRPPAVLVQRMVHADVSGVAFGADPVGGHHDVAVVTAVHGLGTPLVAGECDADTYHVDRAGQILRRHIARKTVSDRFSGNGDARAEQVGHHALTDAQVSAVAELARRAGSHFGRPQDIEWAIAGGKVFLLQSRPITTLTPKPDTAAPITVWDNSNISESYSGVTTPLTFSFARRAYEHVYREFCRLLRVPDERLAASAEVFPRMLGLVRGRVYYNLLNWYRVLALLPGFRANRRFMEQMMGVREGLPEALVEELACAGRLGRLRDRFHLLRSLAALVAGHLGIRRRVRRFTNRLIETLATVPADLTHLRPDELAAHYRELERRLLARWDAPLLNDFLAMIFDGLLGKLTRAWCDDATGALRNRLLCDDGGMVSAEPARRVVQLADIARRSPSLTDALDAGSRDAIEREMAGAPAFRVLFSDYLATFADRCPGELKLESMPLDADPLPLLRCVGQLARATVLPAPAEGETDRGRAALQCVRSALYWRPVRRAIFHWVLKNARARLRDRENLRFERTRLFGKVRRIFVELGRRLHALRVLDDPRDIFYLDAEEAWGFLDGTSACTELRSLARVRRAEFDKHRGSEPPPHRFETRGVVPLSGASARARPTPEGERRQGLGCCPGIVRGPVRVVTDPRSTRLSVGEILVAERTDPGWVVLFPAAAGLLVERGSLLSHSAIVSRELGIPSIVSVPGLTAWLSDGDWVEFDGASGTVNRLAAPEAGRQLVGWTHGQ